MADLRLDVDHQLVKNLERFGLVFDERIALAVAAQADAVAQAVHFIEMLLPQAVNGAEHRVALDLLQRLGVFKADLDFIGIADVCRK